MRTLFAILPAIALAGCAAFDTTQQVKDFHPLAMNRDGTMPLTDRLGYDQDEGQCDANVLPIKHPFGVGSVIVHGGQGLADSASATIVTGNPLVAVAGGAGGASHEALAGLGLNAPEKMTAKAWCMWWRGWDRGTYRVFDPKLTAPAQ